MTDGRFTVGVAVVSARVAGMGLARSLRRSFAPAVDAAGETGMKLELWDEAVTGVEGRRLSLAEIDGEGRDRVMAVNVKSPFLLIRPPDRRHGRPADSVRGALRSLQRWHEQAR